MALINSLLHKYRLFRYPDYKRKYEVRVEKRRLLTMPRYEEGTTDLLPKPLKFVDGQSCHFIYQEIFEQEIYKLDTQNVKPYFIDAGANIGISIIYLKTLYPHASIVAFEPDKKIFDILSQNITTFQFKDVVLIDKALWHEDTTLKFYIEGADAGRITQGKDGSQLVEVQAVKLRPYIEHKQVDFLKIDIEGAEINVIRECADVLKNVDRIFVEYHSFEEREQTLPEMLFILKSAGFRMNISSPGLTSKSPFIKINSYSGMDMQLNIYGYRN